MPQWPDATRLKSFRVEVWTTVRKDQLIRPCVCDDSVNAAQLKSKAWFGQYFTGRTANTDIPTGRPRLILQPLFLAFCMWPSQVSGLEGEVPPHGHLGHQTSRCRLLVGNIWRWLSTSVLFELFISCTTLTIQNVHAYH